MKWARRAVAAPYVSARVTIVNKRCAIRSIASTRKWKSSRTRWLVVSGRGETFKKVLPDAKLVLQGVMRSDMYQLGFDFGGETGEDYQFNMFALV